VPADLSSAGRPVRQTGESGGLTRLRAGTRRKAPRRRRLRRPGVPADV